MVNSDCSYCGEPGGKSGLDRINPNHQHTIANTVACCARCNYLRGDMPYAAWMFISGSVREARETGAFNGWSGGPWRKKIDDTTLA